jgi:hypothetical protein
VYVPAASAVALKNNDVVFAVNTSEVGENVIPVADGVTVRSEAGGLDNVIGRSVDVVFAYNA